MGKPDRQNKKSTLNATERWLKALVRDHPDLADEIERCLALVMPTGPRRAPTPAWDSSWWVEPAEQLELSATLDVIPADAYVFVPDHAQPSPDRSLA
jgi:hypothetical protein